MLYDSVKKLDDAFFKTLPKVEIANVVMFIGDLIGMRDGFTHMKDRYTKKKKAAPLAINACLLSEGFGTHKMADMSDLDISLLRSTREDFVRVDTLWQLMILSATTSIPYLFLNNGIYSMKRY